MRNSKISRTFQSKASSFPARNGKVGAEVFSGKAGMKWRGGNGEDESSKCEAHSSRHSPRSEILLTGDEHEADLPSRFVVGRFARREPHACEKGESE